MWESILKHPLFKVSIVFLLGLFGLSLFFGMISGSGYMGMGMGMGRTGGYGLSFGGLISGLLMLLVKLLMIVLTVAIILGLIGWIRSTFFKNSDMQFLKTINNDPVLRTTAIITIAIFGLMLAGGLLSSLMQPYGMGMHGMGGYGRGFYFGYNPAFGITGLLGMLVQLLTAVLVISLIVAAALYIKSQYESGKFNINATPIIPKKEEAEPGDEMNKIDKTV